MATELEGPAKPLTTRQRRAALIGIQLLVDVVLLNLIVEWVDAVVIDSFSVSVLAAVLIRVLVRATLRAEHRVAAFFKARTGVVSVAGRVLGTWLILFLSKFVILEVVDIAFGDEVELGGFVGVIFVSLSMVVAERFVTAIYQRL